MPIINKRDRNNWYNSIPVENDFSNRGTISADKLKDNEIRCGDAVLAKIPNIPGRIGRRNVTKGAYTTHYIEFILEHHYDSEKGQSRNKRVIIGTDVSHIHRGMMIINDKYHDYFDRKGQMIWHPEPEAAQTEPESAQAEPIPEAQSQPEPWTTGQPETDKLPSTPVSDSKPKATEIKQGKESMQEYKNQEEPEEKYNPDEEEEEEDEEILEQQRQIQRRDDHLEFLHDILSHYNNVVDDQARKKPDKPMSAYQIRRINEILKELKAFFKECEADDYLETAEEPDKNNPDNSGMTYGDMAILLSTYICTLNNYKIGKLWYKQKQ